MGMVSVKLGIPRHLNTIARNPNRVGADPQFAAESFAVFLTARVLENQDYVPEGCLFDIGEVVDVLLEAVTAAVISYQE